MTEIVEPGVLDHKPRRKLSFKTSDIIVLVIILAVIALLIGTLVSKLDLKHDVAAAQVVADKTIADLQKRDGTAAHKLGTKKFQETYSADQLTKQFKAVEIATLKSPKLDNTTVADGKSGRVVLFTYKYTALKVPYYIRVIVVDKSGTWQLTDISGNADKSKLVVN